MRRISIAASILFAVAALALFVGSSTAAASTEAPTEETAAAGEHPGFLAAKGRITYRRYCASCHGSQADGKGNVAQFLKVRPTDLRTLKQKYEGEFPKDIIYQFIDGRARVKTHGSGDMPIWGEVFQSPLVESSSDESGEDRASRKIRELVYWLETQQKEEEPIEVPKEVPAEVPTEAPAEPPAE